MKTKMGEEFRSVDIPPQLQERGHVIIVADGLDFAAKVVERVMPWLQCAYGIARGGRKERRFKGEENKRAKCKRGKKSAKKSPKTPFIQSDGVFFQRNESFTKRHPRYFYLTRELT